MAEQRRVVPEVEISPWLPDVVISAIRAEIEKKNEASAKVFVRPQQCLVDKNGSTFKINPQTSNPDDVRNRIPPSKLWQNLDDDIDVVYYWQRRREIELQREIRTSEKCTIFERRRDNIL